MSFFTHFLPQQAKAVPCSGPVEGVLGSLLSSLTSSLHSQLTSAVSSYLLKEDGSHPPLSLLPSLWASHTAATQVVLLTTQLSLDQALTLALQNKHAIESICAEIQTVKKLIKTAIAMLQGRPVNQDGGEAKSKHSSEEAAVRETSASGSHFEWPHPYRESDHRDGLTPARSSRLQSLLLLLFCHRQTAVNLVQHAKQKSDLSQSYAWQSRLHWSWSSSDSVCHVTTLGAQLPYAYHYTGSRGRVVLTPSTERALVFLLQAASQRNNTILNGPEVCM